MNLRAWIELSRCSNLPTVWSNVLHGLAAGAYVSAHARFGEHAVGELSRDASWYLNQGFMLLVSMSLIYIAGMVLNDAFDAKEDAAERPSRPIPSGRVSRRAAFVVGFMMLGAGVAGSAVYRESAVLITVALLALAVVAYNATHRRTWLGVPFIAICRGLLILAGASAFGLVAGERWWSVVALPAAAIAVYTALVALLAVREADPNARIKPVHIGLILAAMPLLDALFLGLLGHLRLAGVCIGLALLTVVLQRTVRGS
ncbi:MAG: UbiA family prenyltransferase [Planctomycetota bacterium]